MSSTGWAQRLEKRLGWLAVPGLPLFLTGMTAACGILGFFKPEFISALVLDPSRVAAGEAWRLATFLVVPPPAGPLWLALWLAVIYTCLQTIEDSWGDFRLTLFLGAGLLSTAAASLLVGRAFSASVIQLSAFLAFARLAPDRTVLIMFVLPVKVRWLAILAAVLAAAEFLTSAPTGRAHIASGLVPYALFFGPEHWRELSRAWRRRGL